ncbi:heterokaryon incompatibility protein-domain-containing protein [Lophiotrema nucula]|uniref:Heterokaryon incompatibility protein-domain-containing protein n=1 Tax=Lophiotrema nucula TaxID=690887 RepID=A0A6A5ZD05_9PLEO|nr:heterokaryon incompatibility protein-domain-containing protein [Lophiotrema nucula]
MMSIVNTSFGCIIILFVSCSWLLTWLRRGRVTASKHRPILGTPEPLASFNNRSNALLHSCEHCAKILIKLPINFPSGIEYWRYHIPQSIEEARQAAASGCLLFQDLYKARDIPILNRWECHISTFQSVFQPSEKIHTFTGCQTWYERATYFLASIGDQPFFIRFGRMQPDAGRSLYARLLYSSWKSFELDVTARDDDRAADFILERPLKYEVTSNETFKHVRTWLTNCVDGHPLHAKCSNAQHDFVPTRLIEIRPQQHGSFRPRIYHRRQGERLQWATLSYCWGGDQACKTKKSKLDSRSHHLPLVELPRTLQDALVVAHRMGLSYIWIDALCIIQDDPEDVVREIAQMPEIYKYGICTISASRAKSSEEGFLQPHGIDLPHHKPTLIRVKCPDGSSGSVCLAYRGGEYTYAVEPIHKRSWCFQERVLSQRILDFNTTQLRWTCASLTEVDGGKAILGNRTDRPLSESLVDFSREGLDDYWQATVIAYTRRDLTFAGDKLLALSAIATELARHYEDDYFAGLWRHSMSCQLSWHAGRPKYRRVETYVAPSWSWASVRDPVTWDTSPNAQSVLEIVHCEVQLAYSQAPFGSVTDGYIILRGYMRTATWFPDKGDVDIPTESGSLTIRRDREAVETSEGDGRTDFWGWIYEDTLDSDSSKDVHGKVEIHLLKVRSRTEKKGTLCLFLRPTDETRTSYQRIAFMEICDARYRYDPPIETDFFEGVDLQTIKFI